jgi:hypothetical protein
MRGRRITAFLAAGLLGLAAAGCGGDDQPAPEVPGPPADVVIPESAEAPARAGSGDDEGTTDGTSEEDTDGTTDDSGTTTPPEETAPPADETGTTPDSGGGTTAPEADADSPTNDTPPPEGSNAEQFEDFCAQNPGAC